MSSSMRVAGRWYQSLPAVLGAALRAALEASVGSRGGASSCFARPFSFSATTRVWCTSRVGSFMAGSSTWGLQRMAASAPAPVAAAALPLRAAPSPSSSSLLSPSSPEEVASPSSCMGFDLLVLPPRDCNAARMEAAKLDNVPPPMNPWPSSSSSSSSLSNAPGCSSSSSDEFSPSLSACSSSFPCWLGSAAAWFTCGFSSCWLAMFRTWSAPSSC
mmetsp:Transcript_35392/g.78563  ORF Transcript_35392/g.78563 Transcript_35392/m.78563 type:complete len:216 (-) Transcript_35392:285-932(-)